MFVKRLLFFCIPFLFLLPSVKSEPLRNVFLITIDTWRADYLGYNGSQKVKTPALDALAAQGVNFQRARAPVPLTLPSHASILTGLFPPSHGVRDNATFRLADRFTTVTEILQKRGYQTGAFVGSFVLDQRFGLQQGFDVYDDRAWTSPEMLEKFEAERNAESVLLAATRWLKSAAGKRPIFLWMHLYDPHAPYTPPQPFKNRYPGDPYAGEVAYTDSVIARFTETLRQLKLIDQSVIAVTGDHGEGLGEHGESTHSLLIYNSTLHVPMLIVAPGIIRPGIRVHQLCRTIDLAPTILDYIGIQENVGEGVSLRNHIEGRPKGELAAYSESLYPMLNLGWSELTGIESARHRYIQAPRPELYELEKDPGEKSNKIDALPEIARRHALELQKHIRQHQDSPVRDNQIDPETHEKMKSLGYVSGNPQRTSSGSGASDPKEKIAIWNEMQVALFHISRKQFAEAIQRLKKIAATEKKISLVYDYLGNAYMQVQNWDEAEKNYREAIRLGLETPMFRTNLGMVHFHRREYSKAEKELRRSIDLDPQSVTAHYHLGNVYRAAGKLNAAMIHYQKAVQLNSDYVFAWNGLGMTQASSKQDEQAVKSFERAIQIDPTNGAAYFNLAVQLERMNRTAAALDAYKKFLQLSKGSEFEAQRKKANEAISRLSK